MGHSQGPGARRADNGGQASPSGGQGSRGRGGLAAAAAALLGLTLIALSVGTTVSSHQDDREASERALRAAATSEQQNLTSYFERARALTQLLARNPAFVEFYVRRGSLREKVRSGAHFVEEVNDSLAQMGDLTRGVGEACMTDDSGAVNACAVGGDVTPVANLWPNYSWTKFFDPTLRLDPGQVHQTRPYVSQTNYYVIASATPVALPAREGEAIVHVETPIDSFREEAARLSAEFDIAIVDIRKQAAVFDTRPGDSAPVKGSAVGVYVPDSPLPAGGDSYEVDGRLAAAEPVDVGANNANEWMVVAASRSPAPELLDSVGPAQVALLLGGILLLGAAVVLERASRRAAEESDRMKSDLLALVSHELRTPLTSIVGYTELLAELESDRLSEQGRKFVSVIDHNARRELRVVGDLLDLQRIDGGKFTIDAERIDLTPIVEAAIASARPRAEEQGLKLEADLAPVAETVGDRERLGQVVDNLISNAIKYSPEGGDVTVRLRPEGESAVIEVADTGLGIPEEDLDQLFERMFRASNATELHIQGVGLGLSIVKAIVDAHAGTISVRSRLGEGTTFAVELPSPPPEKDGPAVAAASA